MCKGVTHVHMVSCGGGLHIKEGLQWWCKALFGMKAKVRYETHDAADFLSLPMIDQVGPETLVILSSKSGGTKETLTVGKRLKQTGCKVVCFTQSERSEIVKYGNKSFYIGDTPQPFHSMLMLLHAFVGGIWEGCEGWGHLNELLTSLAALPRALAKAALESQSRGNKFAESYDPSGIIYFIGAGPMQFVGAAFGNCLLEEMLGANINAFPANHFFHSLVEKMPVEAGDRLIVVRGLDSADWQAEGVQNWCAGKGVAVDVYDARDYDMTGIDEGIRGMLAPIIVEAALKPIAEPMSMGTKDLNERKYMGMENFWEGSKVVTA